MTLTLWSPAPPGPVADKVKDQHQKTSAEFSNLAASRQTPSNPAATGQPLTHYHSFFSEVLSWNNPRTYTQPSLAPAPPVVPPIRSGHQERWADKALGASTY